MHRASRLSPWLCRQRVSSGTAPQTRPLSLAAKPRLPGLQNDSLLASQTTNASSLLANDPLTADFEGRLPLRSLGFPELTKALLVKDAKAACAALEGKVDSDGTVLAGVPQDLCSKFFDLLPSGPARAKQFLKSGLKFARLMEAAGRPLTADNYAQLINLAFKAREYNHVTSLWQDVDASNIEKTTNLWNQYIMATCDAYPRFWPRDQAPEDWSLLSVSELPPHINNIKDMLVRMEIEGVDSNARTYELAALSWAREGRLGTAEKIITSGWLERKGLSPNNALYPSVSTCKAIIDAYAFNNQLEKGIGMMDRLINRYPHISVRSETPEASKLWSTLLRWVIVSTEPHGPLATTYFLKVWQAITEYYGVKPTLAMWNMRIEFMDWKNQFNDMRDSIGSIVALPEPKAKAAARSAMKRTVMGLSNTGRALEAVSLMEDWAKNGLDVREDLEEYVRRRGGTKQQLEMFEEDDDEDSLF